MAACAGRPTCAGYCHACRRVQLSSAMSCKQPRPSALSPQHPLLHSCWIAHRQQPCWQQSDLTQLQSCDLLHTGECSAPKPCPVSSQNHVILPCMQENAAQQRHVLQAAKAAGLLHKVTAVIAQQLLSSSDSAALLADLTAAPVAPANVFLSEPWYSTLESLPPWSNLRSSISSWHA